MLSWRIVMALLATGFSRVAFIQPVAVYKTGFVPCKCCRTNWLLPGAFLSSIWWSIIAKNNQNIRYQLNSFWYKFFHIVLRKLWHYSSSYHNNCLLIIILRLLGLIHTQLFVTIIYTVENYIWKINSEIVSKSNNLTLTITDNWRNVCQLFIRILWNIYCHCYRIYSHIINCR